MDVCPLPVVVGTRWRPSLNAFALFKGRRYENRTTLFSLVLGSKEQNLFSKFTFLTFLKIGL